jgi:type I restriction enzyme M protein
LVHTLEHLRKQVKTVPDELKIQQSIHGVEKKPLPYMLLLTNMMLHGVEEPITMHRGNTLERSLVDYTDEDQVDCVVTNPPFGGTEEPGIETNFPKEFQTRETADLFLVLLMKLLKKHGRAGIVLPDGFLFGEGMKTGIKKELLEKCNLHTIVRLPKGVFAPYTTIATNLLFFTKGEPTKEIWYYEHPYPEGRKSYTMTDPIDIKEFDVEKKWWKKRVENDRAWLVSLEEIQKRNYNLDSKNPRTKVEMMETPEALLLQYRTKQKEVGVILGKIKNLLTDALSHNATK